MGIINLSKNLDSKSTQVLTGHVSDLSGIEKIGKIERLTLQEMRKMTQNELLPINKMTNLKYLHLWKLKQVTDKLWLTLSPPKLHIHL